MRRASISLASYLILVIFWLGVKSVFDISDRYLPSPAQIQQAIDDVGWVLVWHTAITIGRVLLGLAVGLLAGVGIALASFRVGILQFLMPSANALRAVPAVALIPFFLLWFGFSEWGRVLLLTLGLGVNIFVACADVIATPRERDRVVFHSFPVRPHQIIFTFWLPRIGESILPTLRFGLSTLIGLVVVAEMLGAQSGLGYLIQTSRSTFSLNVIFLCVALLGIIVAALDMLLKKVWTRLIYWVAP